MKAQHKLDDLVTRLRACTRCPKMHRPAVSGGAVLSKVMSVGQAPGVKEPVAGRPFAWTAGKTLFGWFTRSCGWTEAQFRERVYMAAVARCFPGKTNAGGAGAASMNTAYQLFGADPQPVLEWTDGCGTSEHWSKIPRKLDASAVKKITEKLAPAAR